MSHQMLEKQITILDYFSKWVRETPDEIFLTQPKGNTATDYNWRHVEKEVLYIVRTLQHHGYTRGDKIALLSSNCAEWIIYDIALMMGGYISVPLYANVNAQTMAGILEDSEASLLLLGKIDREHWESQKHSIPKNTKSVALPGSNCSGIMGWQDYKSPDKTITETIINPDDVLTIIYTSGTTGSPKGVVHTHRSILNAVITASEEVLLNRKGNRFVSYLPLSHAAERGLVEMGCLYCGGQIFFVESTHNFQKNIKSARPTHFFGVPRIWEKFQTGILKQVSPIKLKILLKTPLLATWIKYRIKQSLGLDKAQVILSGAAPIAPELLIWFQQLGINIREAYGLSENFNVISMNPKDDIRTGTVGKLFENQDVYIDPETKEIRQKCNWLMKGYHNRPELTKKAIVNGYLHTGDMGHLSDDGFLSITGRVKDIFKTTKGEYIAPAPMERDFMEIGAVDQACVMGSEYPQPFILIGLSEIGKTNTKETIHELENALTSVNKNLMGYQKLKKVIVVKEEWTNENDLLTPTLKIKRNQLFQKYEPIMKELFDKEELVSWEV